MELKPHQKFVVEHMKKSNQHGIILFHTLGSGKTITSIAISQLYPNHLVIVCPASLRSQWVVELNKMKVKSKKYTIHSYEGIVKLLQRDELLLDNMVVILDEAHRIRSSGKISKILARSMIKAHKVILLTGTPMVNSIFDISPLINIITGKKTFPLDAKGFYNKFGPSLLDYKKITSFFSSEKSKNIYINKYEIDYNKVKNALENFISYFKPDSTDYPLVEKYIIKVQMSAEQYKMYSKATSAISPRELHMLQEGEDIKITPNFNAFLNATRQVSNTYKSTPYTPKLNKILKYVKQEAKPAIVYSSFLDNGVKAFAKMLEDEKIVYALFTGELNDEKKKKIVEDYNKGKIDVLLLSSSGGEGLDLKNTRQIHIMEPHWNTAKINQVIGRGVRYKSHYALPENHRLVKIYYWISLPYHDTFTKMTLKTGADEYLYMMSDKKTTEIDKFKNILIESSIK
jgi:SNF2 family DNA or RNA helicase